MKKTTKNARGHSSEPRIVTFVGKTKTKTGHCILRDVVAIFEGCKAVSEYPDRGRREVREWAVVQFSSK